MTAERRAQEIELLRRHYGEVDHGTGMDWVRIQRFPLPPGWNREELELLILIPPAYPSTPPDNFFVRNGLRLQDGSLPGNYAEGQSVLGESWAQFSFHAQEWRPSNDLDSDSLLTFLVAVSERLREAN